MNRYIVIEDPNIISFVSRINVHMEENWIPQGSIIKTKEFFYQALIQTKNSRTELRIVPNQVSKEDYQQSITNWKTKFNSFSDFGKAYPIVDIKAELEKASLWLYTNTTKRKKSLDRFFNNWCARVQERGVTTNTPLNNSPLEDL